MFPDLAPRPHLIAAAAAPHDKLVTAAADRPEAPVPCAGWTVRDLAEHLLAWTPVLAGAGRGVGSEPRTTPAEGDWPATLAAERDDLVAAWSDPAAWSGSTRMTATELPGSMVGTMVLCELVVHGWDFARALGVPVTWDDALLTETLAAMEQLTPIGRGTGGAFGPPVDVAADAPLLDRIVAVAGRDPAWTP